MPFCISYLSVAVINGMAKTTKEERVCFGLPSRGLRVPAGGEPQLQMPAWWWEQQAESSHLEPVCDKAGHKQVGWDCKHPKPTSSDILPRARWHSEISPNTTTHCGPGVPVHEPVGTASLKPSHHVSHFEDLGSWSLGSSSCRYPFWKWVCSGLFHNSCCIFFAWYGGLLLLSWMMLFSESQHCVSFW